MLESISSLMESLSTVIQKERPEEYHTSLVDDLIPSLRKIRKVAGKFSVCQSSYLLKLVDGKWLSCNQCLFLSVVFFAIFRTSGHAFKIHYNSLGKWGTHQHWVYDARGIYAYLRKSNYYFFAFSSLGMSLWQTLYLLH